MRKRRQIVERIRRFLASDSEMGLSDLGVLADEYAAACEETNERLRRCEQHLRGGMRTEAIHMAEASPPVLEIAAILHFQGVEAWRDICRGNRLSVPSPILAEIVSWLNRAYIREESLTDLLAEYRRLTRRGSLRQKISLLRRLVKVDADSSSHWRDDLKEFEEARLSHLADDLQAAAGADDLEALETLYSEVTSPEWMLKPGTRLLAQCSEELGRVRKLRAQQEGEEIARQAWQAYGAFDYGKATAALARWEDLVEEGIFVPSEDLAANVAEVQEWHEIEHNKLEQEREFNEAVIALKQAVEKGRQRRVELEQLWYAVVRHNREIPQQLLKRAMLAIEDAKRDEKRVRRLIVAAGCVVVAVIGAVTFLLVRGVVRERIRNEWMPRIAQAIEERQYERGAKLFEELAEQNKVIAGELAFQEREREIDDGLKERDKIRETFETIFQQLDEARRAGFEGPVSEGLLGEVGQMDWALTDEQKMKFKEWEVDRNTDLARRQKERDDRFAAKVDEARESFAALDVMNPELESDKYLEVIGQVNQTVNAAKAMPDISEPLTRQMPSLQARLTSYQEKHQQAIERMEERAGLLKEIANGPPPLEKYEKLLRDFTAKFPDHEATPRFRALIADCVLARDVTCIDDARARGCNFVDPGQATEEWAAAFLESPESTSSVWRLSVERLRDQIKLAPEAQEILQGLDELRQERIVWDLHFVDVPEKESEEIVRYYYVGAPASLRLSAPLAPDEQERHRYMIKAFLGGDSPEDKIIEVPDALPKNPDRTLAGHCIWFRRFHRRVRNANPRELAPLLLEGVEELRKDPDVEPVVKADLILSILGDVKKLSPQADPEIDRLIARLEVADTDVSWMNPELDADTQYARDDIAAMLKNEMTNFESIAWRTKIEDVVYRVSLMRNVRCFGQVEAEGGDLVLDVGRGRRPEVWIATGEEGGVAAIYIAGSADAEGRLVVPPDMKRYLRPGKPLLAPTGVHGGRTAEVLKRSLGELPDTQLRLLKKITWPDSWPVNGRDIETSSNGHESGK